jgi:hypothetical protein
MLYKVLLIPSAYIDKMARRSLRGARHLTGSLVLGTGNDHVQGRGILSLNTVVLTSQAVLNRPQVTTRMPRMETRPRNMHAFHAVTSSTWTLWRWILMLY